MVNLLDSSTFSISLMSVLVTNVRLVFFKYPTEALCGGHCHILPGCPFNCCPRLKVTGTDTCSYLPPQGCPGCRDVPSIKVTLLPGSPTSNDGSICEYKNSLPSYPKSGRLQRAILTWGWMRLSVLHHSSAPPHTQSCFLPLPPPGVHPKTMLQ